MQAALTMANSVYLGHSNEPKGHKISFEAKIQRFNILKSMNRNKNRRNEGGPDLLMVGQSMQYAKITYLEQKHVITN